MFRFLLGLAGLLAALSPAHAQQGKQVNDVATFQQWRATCTPYAGCFANAFINADNDDGLPAHFMLEISRQAYGSFWQIALIAYIAQPDAATAVRFEVDGQAVSFEKPDGFAAYDLLNSYYFLGENAQTIMDWMMPGAVARVQFTDAKAIDRDLQFELAGLTAALLWIDEHQTRVGSERVVAERPEDRTRVTSREPHAVSAQLLARQATNSICEPLNELVNGDEIISNRLDAEHTLHLVPCWSAAYNFGFTAYITDDNGFEQIYFAEYYEPSGWTGTPVLVNPWYDTRLRLLYDFYKGRGLGDCGTTAVRFWDSYQFVMLEFASKSACDAPDAPGRFPVIYRGEGYIPSYDF